MEALIIATGRGSRLRDLCSPKPLTPIFGLQLLERIVLAARIAGVRDFKVVAGYGAERIKKEIGSGERYGVRIEYIDSPEALRRARRTLIRQLFKPTDGPISRSINCRLSTRLSAVLARYDVSPNSLTLASFGLSLLSASFFALGGYGNAAAGGILAQLSSILDGCDGEIARLKFRASTFGKWLDRILDRYADALIVLGITHAMWRTAGNDHVWVIGLLAVIGTFRNSYTAAFHDSLLRSGIVRGRPLRLGRDVRMFDILLGALGAQLLPALVLLAIVTNAGSLRRLLAMRTIPAGSGTGEGELRQQGVAGTPAGAPAVLGAAPERGARRVVQAR